MGRARQPFYLCNDCKVPECRRAGDMLDGGVLEFCYSMGRCIPDFRSRTGDCSTDRQSWVRAQGRGFVLHLGFLGGRAASRASEFAIRGAASSADRVAGGRDVASYAPFRRAERAGRGAVNSVACSSGGSFGPMSLPTSPMKHVAVHQGTEVAEQRLHRDRRCLRHQAWKRS
jgi:hypothetical protein